MNKDNKNMEKFFLYYVSLKLIWYEHSTTSKKKNFIYISIK